MDNLQKDIIKTVLNIGKKPKNIFCLGCAVKVPLRAIVYPALKMLEQKLTKGFMSQNIGNDAHVFRTARKVNLTRRLYSMDPLRFIGERIKRDVRRYKPKSGVVLASCTEGISAKELCGFFLKFYKEIAVTRRSFHVGKGHTIQISKSPEQRFMLIDYLDYNEGEYYGVANNDTIVTIDFNLKHSHWLNVFIALNNALNDLYALGVYENITIYPTYDSIYENDNELIRENLGKYISRFKRYSYSMVDLGPQRMGLEMIGATAVGLTDRELPRMSGLIPGQILIATRPIGDLAALVSHIIKKIRGTDTQKDEKLKIDVLSNMATPNIQIAKIISEYMPLKGDDLDPEKHITATKDISGEGLYALEEMAIQSKVDIYLTNIKLHAKETASLRVPNNTSNTNGAILIAVHRKLLTEVLEKLKKVGCDAWIMAEVGARNRNPIVYIKKTLLKFDFIKYRANTLFDRFKYID